MEEKEKILLHVCCGPCSTSSIERLLSMDYIPLLFFSDSNIYPESEFEKRYANALRVASFYALEMIREEQDHDAWLSHIKGFEGEEEGGKRCALCFDYNMKRTYMKARELGIPYFTTTLTVSRFKSSPLIFSVGEKYDGFCAIDFKKKNGFARSIELSRQLELYRQSYCGCEFSMRRNDG